MKCTNKLKEATASIQTRCIHLHQRNVKQGQENSWLSSPSPCQVLEFMRFGVHMHTCVAGGEERQRLCGHAVRRLALKAGQTRHVGVDGVGADLQEDTHTFTHIQW